IRFWDIRSNKNELYMIKGNEKKDNGISCLKFIVLKKKDNTKNVSYDLNLCYGSDKGPIRIWRIHKYNKWKLIQISNRLQDISSIVFFHCRSLFFKNCLFAIQTSKTSKYSITLFQMIFCSFPK
ncbi:hypothetical protein RFI_28563, partial [Reticulomyxa filosa]